METQKCPYCGASLVHLKEELAPVARIEPALDGESFRVHLREKYECEICGASGSFPLSSHTIFRLRLPKLIQDTARVALFQNHLAIGEQVRKNVSSKQLFAWDEQAAEQRCLQLRGMIESLVKLEPNLNILAFPELSIPPQAHAYLQSVATDRQMIILGGTFYTEDRKNVCPIFVPNQVVHTEKIHPSPWEDGQLETHRMRRGEAVYVLENAHGRWIMPLICKDFLKFYDVVHSSFRKYITLLICLAATPTIEDFHRAGAKHAADSKYVGISCSVGEAHIPGDQPRKLKGGTCFFGSLHDMYKTPYQQEDHYCRLLHLCSSPNIQQSDVEGVLVATVDLESPFAGTIPMKRDADSYCNFRDCRILVIRNDELIEQEIK